MKNGPVIESLRLSDGYEASARWWRPSGARGAVLYFHGIQSHGGWYETSGGLLAKRGMTVLMPDRRGSGLNKHERGHVESASRCVEDARDALAALRDETGESSAHVIGVSWGGRLAVALACQVPEQVRSVTLIAPGLFPRIDLPQLDKFRVALAMLNEPERMIDIPLNEASMFTDNPERIAYVEADPLKLMRVTAAFLLATRRMDRYARQLAGSGWPGGLHLMLAGREVIIDNERTRRWFEGLGLADKRLKEYPKARHTLEFEADPSEFLRDLVDWIDARR